MVTDVEHVLMFSGIGSIEHIVALVHGDLHAASTVCSLKQLADCTFSLCQQRTCRTLLKHQSGKLVIAVCLLS